MDLRRETGRGAGTRQGARTDTAALEAVALPEPPAELTVRRVRFTTVLKFFGPGAVIASLTVGSGESILASREGAVFGYALLWAVVLGAVVKAALVYVSNRHITLTGEHPMARFAKVFPGPRGWFPVLIGAIAIASFPTWSSGLSVAVGDYLAGLGLGDATVLAVSMLLLAAALSWLGGYALLEKAQVAIVALMVALVVVAVFVARPDWAAALGGLLPQPAAYLPFVGEEYPDIADTSVWVEVTVFLGGLGGGMYDYIGYTGLLREKRWGMLGHADADRIADALASSGARQRVPLATTAENVARAKAWSRAPLLDMLVAFFALTVIAAAFMVNGANILGADRVVPAEDEVLDHQAQFLSVISPVFESFYVVAIVMVLFGTLYALWEVYSWTAYESLAAVSERVRRAGQRSVRPYVYAWTGLGALTLVLTGLDFVALVTPGAILGGMLACGVYAFGLLQVDRVNMPPELRIGMATRVLLWVAGVVLTVAGAVAFGQYLGVLG